MPEVRLAHEARLGPEGDHKPVPKMRVQRGCRNGVAMFGILKRTGVKFCPKCKSIRLRVRYLDPFSLQPKYHCSSCGFSSFIVPQLDKEEVE
jgi:predicted RNA-binding Zn-ribbon protein involved in translation (DUF1610 family)